MTSVWVDDIWLHYHTPPAFQFCTDSLTILFEWLIMTKQNLWQKWYFIFFFFLFQDKSYSAYFQITEFNNPSLTLKSIYAIKWHAYIEIVTFSKMIARHFNWHHHEVDWVVFWDSKLSLCLESVAEGDKVIYHEPKQTPHDSHGCIPPLNHAGGYRAF